MEKFKRIVRHLWLDTSDAKRAVPPALLQRLTQQVSKSEREHTGQVRICVEASLPLSYLRRLTGQTSINQLVRERAVMLFGKLRVWDTEQNNGVLIYLQLAEHAIEIVADRGLSRNVQPQDWQVITRHMGTAFGEGRFEVGLTQALQEVSTLLVRHFPAVAGEVRANELPNEPVIN